MCSVHQGIFSTLGVLSTLGEYHEYTGGIKYIGGYHECIGEGDVMNTLEDVQYIGGYYDACGGIPCLHSVMFSTSGDIMSTLKDIMSTLGFSIKIERIYQVTPPNAS